LSWGDLFLWRPLFEILVPGVPSHENSKKPILQFTVQYGDEKVDYKAGASAQGALAGWRKARDDPELGAQAFTGELLIWGQPAAWADQCMCSWVSDYIASVYSQAVLLVDCLGAQWEPETLCRCWLNQQAQIPIAPNATSFLQPADTHCHGQLKACIFQAQAQTQEEWDRHALQKDGHAVDYKWGPAQAVTVMAEA